MGGQTLTRSVLVGLYALTVLVSAALLFLVQPMFARMVLPLLGGSPSVWNTALVFYQVVLLAGYAYAYALTKWLRIWQQTLVHLVVIATAFFLLPVALPHGWMPPTTHSPAWWLLAVLSVAVGLPFFVVAASSPLLQRWFAATKHPAARDPYFLYGASNLGSLLALVGYPLVVERWLRLGDQSRWWSRGYVALALLIAGCAAALWRTRPAVGAIEHAPTAGGDDAPVTWRERWLWMALAAMPVSFMLSVTTYISTDIAAIPLLWIVPLALYLLTLIVTFAPRPLLPHAVLVRVLPFALALLAFLLAAAKDITSWQLIVAHLATFVLASLVAHGELARRRPAARHLTEFYLWISLGGALGGIFNALVAPIVFNEVVEYPLTVMWAAVLLPHIGRPAAAPLSAAPRQVRRAKGRAEKRKSQPALEREPSRREPLLDLLVPVAMFGLVTMLALGLRDPDHGAEMSTRVGMFGIPAAIALVFLRRPLRFALCLGSIVLGSALYLGGKGTYLETDRTFFGINHVLLFVNGGYHMLDHGNTLHGAQSLEPGRRREPLTYYHPTGPLGDVFGRLREQRPESRVAVVGLGAGSTACYRRPGEAWTFYEIDPAVVRIASDTRYFTYLQECAPDARLVVGDARLQLAAAPAAAYDLIVLDAYSSDAVPIHLMTAEAFDVYFDKLAPHGMLALNVSNRHIDFGTVLGNLARERKLALRVRNEMQIDSREEDRGKLPSQWAVLARTTEDLGALATDPRWVFPDIRPDTSMWTDDFNNLFSVFNW